jgi:hypothetical protein
MFETLRHTRPLPLSWLAIWRLAGGAALFLAITACASAPLPPNRELQAAQTAIDSAEQARVADYASPELGQARDKLSAARAAVQQEDMESARRLAEQSQVDAQLALAKAQATKARLVNEEMLKSTNSLKEEMQRNTGVQP